ncbi:hypothetical protein F5Y07DRAFT_91450 [Xylaria sp. FL0933]|nr:hypothetical protein F5Y07DRAFT_91450 [Xylaria sp. FL0933]
MAAPTDHQEPWYLKRSVPVLFPTHDGFDLSISRSAFDALVQDIVRSRDIAKDDDVEEADDARSDEDDSLTLVSAATTTQELRGPLEQLDLVTVAETQTGESTNVDSDKPDENTHPFIQGLLSYSNAPESVIDGQPENRMLTENSDVAYRSTTSALVDLFVELEDVVSGPRLLELLNAAWEADSLATLKIIFNARSIHLGKASRSTFYRCAGWLAQYHPLTLIANLRWLSRPVIQKKAEKKEEADPEVVVVEVNTEGDADNVTRFDVRHGVSHGYWKDLLNILVLGVEGGLHVLFQPQDILNTPKQNRARGIDQEEAKTRRHSKRNERHEKAIETFNSNAVYRGLYLAIGRLFAEQLKKDLALLKSKDPKARRDISLCAKWAPSHDRSHDKHTFIVSSIAEMLHPMAEMGLRADSTDRELYLRHAREEYRKDMSVLRAHLDVVERHLSAQTYGKIKYDHVPSLAMKNYSKLFAKYDAVRFGKYIKDVAEGRMHISGATLLPSTLIKAARVSIWNNGTSSSLSAQVTDMQWKTLVQRIKDSGTLESSIAVCDVSCSMCSPCFPDGTCPRDTAIGLSLLLAEVTEPPFGGHFITFSAEPQVQSVDLCQSLQDKYSQLKRSEWSMNTNFVAVFDNLILPMALRNKLSQEQMVKRVFVFSDMQFDAAETRKGLPGASCASFASSFERLKGDFEAAGYDMPELIFWNLAGGRAGYRHLGIGGDPTVPKPVTSEEAGTTIVSGYSQAMLKLFLENGSFDDPEDENVEEDVETKEEGDTVVVGSMRPSKKRKFDPLSTVRKAIGHKSYDPLVVMD